MNDEEITYREEIDSSLPRPAAVSWGAILAGLVAMLGVSWMLYLFGIAIGVSVADVSDDTLLDDGLPQAVALWMVVSAGIAYFVGSALAARLAGAADDTNGMLHGVALWGTGVVATLLLGYCGLNSALQTGQSFLVAAGAVASDASAVAGRTAANSVAGIASGVTSGAAALQESEVANTVRERLKERVAEAIASVDQPDGADVSAEEIRNVIEGLSANKFDRLVADLADGDQESAAELIAAQTDLSADQADALIDGAYAELEDRFGDPSNDTGLAGDLRAMLARQVGSVVASADAEGGEDVTAEEVTEAIQSLDQEAFEEITNAAMASDWSRVQDLIVEETDLSSAETREIVRGVKKGYQSRIDAVAEAVDGAVETTSTYAQQVLWAAFATTALGLAVSVAGGWCGADTNRRLYREVREKRTVS